MFVPLSVRSIFQLRCASMTSKSIKIINWTYRHETREAPFSWLFNCYQNWKLSINVHTRGTGLGIISFSLPVPSQACYEFSIVDDKFLVELKLILEAGFAWWDRTHENFTHGYAYRFTMMSMLLQHDIDSVRLVNLARKYWQAKFVSL